MMKFLGKIIFLVLLSYAFSACNFKQEQLPPDGMRSVLIKNSTLDFEYWLGSSENSDDRETYQLYIANDSLKGFTIFMTDLLNSPTTFNPSYIQAITVYTDTIFTTKTAKLFPTNIKGLQVYYVEDEYLKTAVFSYENETAQKITQLTSHVDYFSTNDIYDVSKIFKSDRNSVFIVINGAMKSKYKTGKEDFKESLTAYKKQHL